MNKASIGFKIAAFLSFVFRYQFKLTGIFSTGLGLMIQYDKYRIKQDDNYSFTDKPFVQAHQRHQKERFSNTSYSGEAFLRINLDPHRGEYMGFYLEGGVGG